MEYSGNTAEIIATVFDRPLEKSTWPYFTRLREKLHCCWPKNMGETSPHSNRYTRLVHQHPYAILFLALIFVGACLKVLIFKVQLPDFQDPETVSKGFRARGTKVSDQTNTIRLLMKGLDDGHFSYLLCPKEFPRCDSTYVSKSLPHYFSNQWIKMIGDPTESSLFGSVEEQISTYCERLIGMFDSLSSIWLTWLEADSKLQEFINNSSFPCPLEAVLASFWIEPKKREENSLTAYLNSKPKVLVFSSSKSRSTEDHVNIFTVPAIREICEAEITLYDYPDPDKKLEFCPPLSITYVMEKITGKKVVCDLITSDTLAQITGRVEECQSYYHQGILKACYAKPESPACHRAPPQCTKDHAVFILLYYVVNQNFTSSLTAHLMSTHLRFVRKPNMTDLTQYYRDKLESVGQYGDKFVKVTAVNLGVEYHLFLIYNVFTMLYFILAGFLIVVVMFLKVRDLFVIASTLFVILAAFIVAQFIYTIVLGFSYIPLINTVAALLLVAIGADDVFIFHDIWEQLKEENPDIDKHLLVKETFRHAATSVFVTSFTTAAAFLSNATTSLLDIRLFGIFTGIAVLVNFVMMIVWIPPALVISDRMCQKSEKQKRKPNAIQRFFKKIRRYLNDLLFRRVLPFLIGKFSIAWIVLLSLLGVAGVLSVTFWPRLQLPSIGLYQLFMPHHPYEMYRNEMQDQFDYSSASSKTYLPINIIWGVPPGDSGAFANPEDYGELSFDHKFDYYSETTQIYLKRICEAVVRADMLNSRFFPIPHKNLCLFNAIQSVMTNPCKPSPKTQTQSPLALPSSPAICCEKTFPYDRDVLKTCLPSALLQLIGKGQITIDLPIFNNRSEVVASHLQFISNRQFKFSHGHMQKIYDEMEAFLDNLLQAVPSSLQDGWISSQFHFLDLQNSLLSNVVTAMGLSLAMSFVVLLFTSLNIVLTVYAMLTIGFTIFVTTGILVLCGWEINVIESIDIIMTVGLSIDFSIHYSVAYRMAEEKSRRERVEKSLQRVGAPIFMAAITTFLAGASMMPTTLNTYFKFGSFLMLVMVVSWVYATFFFQSLCYLLGPQDNCGQITLPEGCSCCFSSGGGGGHLPTTTVAPLPVEQAPTTIQNGTDRSRKRSVRERF